MENTIDGLTELYDEMFKVVVQPIKAQPLIGLFLAVAVFSGMGVFMLSSIWTQTVAFCYMVLNLLLALIFVMEG